MNPPAPQSPSGVLGRCDCFHIRGGVPCSGVLTLTTEKLVFVGTGVLSRWLGAQLVEVPLESVFEARIAGPDRHMAVVTADRVLRFAGSGVGIVREPLAELLATRDDHDDSMVVDLFSSDDRIVLRGPLKLYVNRLMAVPVELELTTHRLRLTTSSKFERWAWGTSALDVALHEITDIARTPFRRLLRLVVGRQPYVLGGSLVPSLLGALAVVCGDEVTERLPPGEREQVVDVWRARVELPGATGRAVRGVLVVGTHRLVFAPVGLLARRGAAPRTNIPLADLTRVALPPRHGRQIVLQSGAAAYVVHAGEASERLRELGRLMVGVRDRSEPVVMRTGAIDNAALEELWEPWAGHLPRLDGEEILLAGPAVQWEETRAVRRGFVGLTNRRVVFLPAGGPMGMELPLSVPLDARLRLAMEGANDRSLSLAPDGSAELTPRGGKLLVDAFRAHLDRLVPAAAGQEVARTGQAIDDVLGWARFVVLRHEGEELVRLLRARVLRLPSGVGLAFQGTPDAALEVGRALTVEVGRSVGLYRFQTRILDVTRLPEELRLAPDEHGVLLSLESPVDVERVERRTGYRVRMDDRATVHHLVKTATDRWTRGDAVADCRIENLSIVGCGIASVERIPDGARLSIELPLISGLLDVRAEVVRSREPKSALAPSRYGLRFESLREGARDRIHHEIMARQRAEAAQRHAGQED